MLRHFYSDLTFVFLSNYKPAPCKIDFLNYPTDEYVHYCHVSFLKISKNHGLFIMYESNSVIFMCCKTVNLMSTENKSSRFKPQIYF